MKRRLRTYSASERFGRVRNTWAEAFTSALTHHASAIQANALTVSQLLDLHERLLDMIEQVARTAHATRARPVGR